ncbi:hypothetical protein DICSQDRAFT_147170 [Dichomitus squalens LYAD-421 SS1]|uniref:Uncharacterized protein n=1 Tax=Dichomitus squalens (strain LYAD-421) TaxID=732165 RepID=R7SZ33_DICSQ|nr:uncharacterized protein DICSQDRAFT_147170 [Dichomitus squalens LYAD-421 SS1]EJF61464.1 hypothetical protein DICSQDRAFT_147170 [Dichomitus squalens LYAD-421 SS1]
MSGTIQATDAKGPMRSVTVPGYALRTRAQYSGIGPVFSLLYLKRFDTKGGVARKSNAQFYFVRQANAPYFSPDPGLAPAAAMIRFASLSHPVTCNCPSHFPTLLLAMR